MQVILGHEDVQFLDLQNCLYRIATTNNPNQWIIFLRVLGQKLHNQMLCAFQPLDCDLWSISASSQIVEKNILHSLIFVHFPVFFWSVTFALAYFQFERYLVSMKSLVPRLDLLNI